MNFHSAPACAGICVGMDMDPVYRDRYIPKKALLVFLRTSKKISLVSCLKAKVLTMNAACGFRSEANEARDSTHFRDITSSLDI